MSLPSVGRKKSGILFTLVAVLFLTGLVPRNASAFLFEFFSAVIAVSDQAWKEANRTVRRARLEVARQPSPASSVSAENCVLAGSVKMCTRSDGSSNCLDLLGKVAACPAPEANREATIYSFSVHSSGQAILMMHGPAKEQWTDANSIQTIIPAAADFYPDTPLSVLYYRSPGQSAGTFHIFGFAEDPERGVAAVEYMVCDEMKLWGSAQTTLENRPCSFKQFFGGWRGTTVSYPSKVAAALVGDQIYLAIPSDNETAALPDSDPFLLVLKGQVTSSADVTFETSLTGFPGRYANAATFLVLGDSIHLFGSEAGSGRLLHIVSSLSQMAWTERAPIAPSDFPLASTPTTMVENTPDDTYLLVAGTEALGGTFNVRPQARLWKLKIDSSLNLSNDKSFGTDVSKTGDYVGYNPYYPIAALLDPKDGRTTHIFYNGKSSKLAHASIGPDGQYLFENIGTAGNQYFTDASSTPAIVSDSSGDIHVLSVSNDGKNFGLLDYVRPAGESKFFEAQMPLALGKVGVGTPSLVAVE